MARTVGSLITTARGILQDRDADSYRYSDSDLVGFVNDALSEIHAKRPDAFYPSFTYDAFTAADVDDNTKTLPIDDRFFTALVYFVVGSAELRDDEFTVDSRAITLLTQFNNKLMGVS